eukprot:CAMPEP_0202468816 /NCGR_PEP_ID=MMETSP1360-20130828/76523_1 /ASSEMBLY_ACC=CAM_ASM_000848 /TAXON_ID=515479 /ORGANISM="Licmophora paradoxa, Strain CCMP2313" /LENGTH=77 /DNA_ID=CAMNT_0049093913 /DNA_START=9 /DNA_END=239 /DNA_ORIENTATION=-
MAHQQRATEGIRRVSAGSVGGRPRRNVPLGDPNAPRDSISTKRRPDARESAQPRYANPTASLIHSTGDHISADGTAT